MKNAYASSFDIIKYYVDFFWPQVNFDLPENQENFYLQMKQKPTNLEGQ